MSEPYLCVRTAAAKSGLDYEEILSAIREYRLRARRINGRFFVTEDSLLKFLDEHYKPKA